MNLLESRMHYYISIHEVTLTRYKKLFYQKEMPRSIENGQLFYLLQ